MIVFYKVQHTNTKRINIPRSVKVSTRVKINKKITKNNKKFLQALGFKI